MSSSGCRIPILGTDAAQDKVLEEFLDKNKVKSALDQLDKRIKKTKKEGHLLRLQLMRLLLLIYRDRQLHATMPNVRLQEYILPHITALVSLAPQFAADPECIDAVEDIACGTWSSTFWKEACEAHSQNDQIFEAWFETQVRKEQYDEAAKACFIWRRSHPQKFHELTWRMILCHFLASMGASVDDKQKKMSKLMCATLIKQAVENTPTQNDKIIAMRSREDLELVCAIYSRLDMRDELLALTLDDTKGIRSPLGSWNVAQLRLTTLGAPAANNSRNLEPQEISQLETYCRELLTDVLTASSDPQKKQHWSFGEAGDDLRLYRYLTILTTKETYDATRTLHEKLAQSGSFNAQALLPAFHAEHSPREVILEAAKNFWSKFSASGKTTGLAGDLHSHPDVLSDVVNFSCEIPDKGHIHIPPCLHGTETTEKHGKTWDSARGTITGLSQALALTFSTQSSTATVLRVIMSSVDLWKHGQAYEAGKAAADNCVGDEALIVAARGCLYLQQNGGEEFNNALTWARLLLQEVLEHSRHNFRALILLVRVCLYQGAATMAMSYYQRLDIKNLQFITESALLFRDLSLLQPQTTYSYDPVGLLKKMHDWIISREQRQINSALESFEKGNWVSAMDFIETKNGFFASPEAAMIDMEICRMANRLGSLVDPKLAASAIERLTRNAPDGEDRLKTAEGGSSKKRFHPFDCFSKEYPEEHKWLSLSQATPYQDFESAVRTTIMVHEMRALMQGLPVQVCRSEVAIPAIFKQIRLLVMSSTADQSLVEAAFAKVNMWLDRQCQDLPKLFTNERTMPANLGLFMVVCHSLLDVTGLLSEVCGWLAPSHKQETSQLRQKMEGLEHQLRGELAQRSLTSQKQLDSIVESSSVGLLGGYMSKLIGSDPLRSRLSSYLDSTQLAFDGLKARIG